MHPYLLRLGVHTEVQDFFAPHYSTDMHGDLSFDYGDGREVYGVARHKVPSVNGLWIAGNENSLLVRRVFICASAMEAIAWLNCHLPMMEHPDQLCFVATGCSLSDDKLSSLRTMLGDKQCSLLFGNDLLGRICDLRIASTLRSQPVSITAIGHKINIAFRFVHYEIDAEEFSLNKFEKLAAFRFNVQTLKPKGALTWLDRLKAAAFDL